MAGRTVGFSIRLGKRQDKSSIEKYFQLRFFETIGNDNQNKLRQKCVHLGLLTRLRGSIDHLLYAIVAHPFYEILRRLV
jgi:hypothetical protein